MGVGGSGKQSLARLAGHICGYSTYTIVISGNYNMNNFKEELQKMYKRAGVKASLLIDGDVQGHMHRPMCSNKSENLETSVQRQMSVECSAQQCQAVLSL